MHEELPAILAADLPHRDDSHRLADLLYRRCYTHSIFDSHSVAGDAGTNGDLTDLFIEANAGRPAWDEGWRIDKLLDDGRILARKGNAARAFLSGEYLTRRALGHGPEAGKPIAVFLPTGTTETQTGFYHAFGNTAADLDEGEWILRFYWNISAAGAPRLIAEVTREFNRFSDCLSVQMRHEIGALFPTGRGLSAIIRKRSFLNMRPKPATSSAPKAQSSV